MALAPLVAACAATPTTADRYRALEAYYEDRGLMRTDSHPADAPFTKADLVRNFELIAFHKEFSDAAALTAEMTPTRLVKWEAPITYQLIGDAATPQDRKAYAELTARLSRLTGVEFREVQDSEAGITIMIASAELRDAFVRMARERIGGMMLIEEWSRNDIYPCVGQVSWTGDGAHRVQRAIIAVKGETEGLLRESCIQEEFVQTLGLLNDDPSVRPSIFNDDQEFALLTEHDEYLLRILYDPRLRFGMTAEEGMPLVRRIVDEIGPEDDASAPPSPGAGQVPGGGV